MYDERKEKFSFKSFFLTLLLVLLFVFLMLWIFPTKWDIKDNLQSTYDLERLSVLYDEIFANNVARMKDAAIGYFTDERMPQKVGESKKLTLREMYDLHLVLKMKDKNGKPCDETKSYVEMTKYTEEYRLKVNLSCGNQEDYIIVYLGCYNYCSGGICEKRVPTPSPITKEEEKKPTSEPEPSKPTPEKHYCEVVNGKYYDKKGNVVSKLEYDISCNTNVTPTEKYMYEYKLEIPASTTCSNWSSWTKTPIIATKQIEVETKTEKEIKEYKTVTVQTGTKIETVTKKVNERYISGYSTKLVVVGTKDVQTGTTTKEVTEKVAVGTVEKFVGVDSGTKVPEDTSTVKYRVISTDTPDSCSYCENETKYVWEIYNVQTVYDVVTKTETVPVYKKVNVYEKQQIPVYSYRTVEKVEKVEKPVYEDKKVPVYHDVKYYRSKTCKTTPSSVDIKWTYNKIDADLINKGYKFTGNVKKV